MMQEACEKEKASYKFIDLFCGAGGFSCGLQQVGLECIGGIELNEVIAKTHRLNHKNSKTVAADIREVSPERFAKIIETDKVDVITGGPSCPTFSTIGDAKIRSPQLKKDCPRNTNPTVLKGIQYQS